MTLSAATVLPLNFLLTLKKTGVTPYLCAGPAPVDWMIDLGAAVMLATLLLFFFLASATPPKIAPPRRAVQATITPTDNFLLAFIFSSTCDPTYPL